jgi:hypothetical protein
MWVPFIKFVSQLQKRIFPQNLHALRSFYSLNYITYKTRMGYALAQLVEALCCKSEGRGFDS